MENPNLDTPNELADKIINYEAIIKPLAGDKFIDIQWAFAWDCSAFGDHREYNYFRLLREHIEYRWSHEVLLSYLEYLKTALAVLLVKDNGDCAFRRWFQEAMLDQFADHSVHPSYLRVSRLDLAQKQWDEFMEVENGSH